MRIGRRKKHPPMTVAECRAEHHRWAGRKLRNYCLVGGAISYVLFWGLLLFNIYGPEIAERWGMKFTVWFWMLFNALLVGLIWLAWAVTSLVGFLVPRTRRVMVPAFLMHLVFAAAVTPGIISYAEVFRTYIAPPPKPVPLPAKLVTPLPRPTPPPPPASSPAGQ